MLIDRRFRLARTWSNKQLKQIAPLFAGDIVNVSAWDDRDKEGSYYRDYFDNAHSYSYTNYTGHRGLVGVQNEYELDLTGFVPTELIKNFDVAFNHTTLEHIFDVRLAFANLCKLSKDIVIVVVPFSQVQHESVSYGDYWRFTPTCLHYLFQENGLSVVYEAETPYKNSAVYLFCVASRMPEKWKGKLPKYHPLNNAGSSIGYSVIVNIKEWALSRFKKS